MRLSIIIVSYNSANVLYNCLTSLEKHKDLDDLEVVVVENYQGVCETESLIDSFQKHGVINLKFIQNPKNNGFGAGNNLGVANSSGDVLFFLNPDTELTQPTFKQICNSITDNNDIIGFQLVTPNLKPNNSYSIFPQYFPLYFVMNLVKKNSFYLPNRVKCFNRIVWPWGAAFALRRETFVACGCFDEDIFLCYEEPDLLMRIPKRRVKILHIPIIHLEGHQQVISDSRFYSSIESLQRYCKKYNHSFYLMFAYMRFSVWFRLLLHPGDENFINFRKAIKRFQTLR